MVADLSSTWRWLVLLLFFILALILGIVVLIHLKKNGCKGDRPATLSETTDMARGIDRRRASAVIDRDINQWKDLEVDLPTPV